MRSIVEAEGISTESIPLDDCCIFNFDVGLYMYIYIFSSFYQCSQCKYSWWLLSCHYFSWISISLFYCWILVWLVQPLIMTLSDLHWAWGVTIYLWFNYNTITVPLRYMYGSVLSWLTECCFKLRYIYDKYDTIIKISLFRVCTLTLFSTSFICRAYGIGFMVQFNILGILQPRGMANLKPISGIISHAKYCNAGANPCKMYFPHASSLLERMPSPFSLVISHASSNFVFHSPFSLPFAFFCFCEASSSFLISASLAKNLEQ